MRPTFRSSRLAPLGRLALLTALLTALPALAEPAPELAPEPATERGWPQFRGPERSGLSTETGLLDQWPEGGPQEIWRRPIGPGFSGILVAGDRIYTLFGVGEPAPPEEGTDDGEPGDAPAEAETAASESPSPETANPQPEALEMAAAFDATTGKELWRTPIGPLFTEVFGNGPRSTPTLDGDTLFALSSTGVLNALAAADGESLWSVDLRELYGVDLPTRGYAPSPLVVGDVVVIEAGGGEGEGLVAFDRKTGERRWGARDTAAGYASTLVVPIGGVDHLVTVPTAGREIVALDTDGRELWTHPWPPGTLAMPLFLPPDRIFVSATADVGALVLRVIPETNAEGETTFRTEEVWKSRRMRNHFSSSVFQAGTLYGFDNGTLAALDADTGERHWAQRGFGKGSLLLADGLLFILSDQGTLAVAEATPEAYRELGQLEILTGRTWTAPSLAGGRLYLRDHEEMVCLDVREPKAASAEAPEAPATAGGAA